MSICCLNPDCPKPINPDGTKYCITCGIQTIPLLCNNRFRIIKRIGQGGFACTYLAEDTHKLDEHCVVKQLIANTSQGTVGNKVIDLFKREAKQLQQLGNNNRSIPSLFAYFSENNMLFLAQEFIEGKNLAEIVASTGIWSENQVKWFLIELLNILKFVHEQGVIHRDLKPQNIMVRDTDNQFVLIDFGVAKDLSATVKLSQIGTVVGTYGYAAFEQMKRGEAQSASDLFSLGVTCFYLLTGADPDDLFLLEGYSWTNNWRKHLKSPLRQDLDKVIDKLLKPDIKERYQSAAQVWQDLQPTPAPTPVRVTMPAPAPMRQLQTFRFNVITVDRYGKEISRTPGNAQYFTENLSGISLDMVFIKGDTFIMGSPDSESGRYPNEGPQHRVTVPDFYMGKYAVTQAQYQAIMGNNPSRFKGDNRPVEQVSWDEAVAFCQKLSGLTGKNYRLPSEAEWEYACRGGTTTPFHFGETITPDLVNYDGNYPYAQAPKGKYREKTTEVGSFPPNAFGLYDMHGNVWEWCEDIWHDNYNGAPADGTSWLKNQHNNTARLLRGGSWESDAVYCRSADRIYNSPGLRNVINFGFRLVVRQ